MNRSFKKTPGRSKFNAGIKRRSFGRSNRRLSNLSFKSTNASTVDTASNIKVVVRVRPFNDHENSINCRCIVHVPDRTWLVFDPIEEKNDFFFQGKKSMLRDINIRPNKDKTFEFDRVFDGDCSNLEVFEETTKPIIESLMNGFNCSVFAYGATGAGKTHTMVGNEKNPGITFLMVMELFRRIEMVNDKDCEILVSYLEVYNESIKDLLVPSVALQIREDVCGVKVQGLSMHKPSSPEDLLKLLEYGNKSRTQHPTDANAESSRSHAVFQVYLKQTDKVTGPSENIRIGKMSLVDLAGSERATAIRGHNKARLKEGASINQSLLALGSCINALADKKKGNHIPYRNSKLTRILKDSLGGNCITVMIAAVSPASLTYDDTHNTLNYASRAKAIKVTLKRNDYNVESHVSQYKKIMESQKIEIAQLKQKLKEYEEESNAITNEVVTISAMCQTSIEMETNQEECKLEAVISDQTVKPSSPILLQTRMNVSNSLGSEFLMSMEELFTKQIKIRTQILNCESDAKSLAAKRQWRKHIHNQVHCMTWCRDRLTRSTLKLESALKASEVQEARLRNLKERYERHLQTNLEQIMSLLNQKYETVSLDNSHLRLYMDKKKLEVEITGLNVQTQHIIKILNLQTNENTANWRLSEQALSHVKEMHLLLKEHGFLSSNIVEDYEKLLGQVEGSKEVIWADQLKSNNEPEEYIKSFVLLPIYKFTRESMSPWNRKSQSGLPCNPFSSTPYVSNSKKTLTAYHSTDKPGDHSYIQVDSFLSNNVEDDSELEKLASPLVYDIEQEIPLVPSRGKHGSPFPLIKAKPISRSLEDTFDMESNNQILQTLRNYDEKFTPKKDHMSNLDSQFKKKIDINLFPEINKNQGFDLDTPPSPVRQTPVTFAIDTPPSPAPNHHFALEPVKCDNTFVYEDNHDGLAVDAHADSRVNQTYLAQSPKQPSQPGKVASKSKPFAFLQPKTPIDKLFKRSIFSKGSSSKLGEIATITQQPVQPVAPVVRNFSKPSLNVPLYQRHKLASGVSTPNLHIQGSLEKKLKQFQLPTRSSTLRKAQTPQKTNENAQPSKNSQTSNLGLRESSLGINKPRYSSLYKSKSHSVLPQGPFRASNAKRQS